MLETHDHRRCSWVPALAALGRDDALIGWRKAPTYGCRKRGPAKVPCFAPVLYREPCNSNVSSRNGGHFGQTNPTAFWRNAIPLNRSSPRKRGPMITGRVHGSRLSLRSAGTTSSECILAERTVVLTQAEPGRRSLTLQPPIHTFRALSLRADNETRRPVQETGGHRPTARCALGRHRCL
jgi:hypothetical protein